MIAQTSSTGRGKLTGLSTTTWMGPYVFLSVGAASTGHSLTSTLPFTLNTNPATRNALYLNELEEQGNDDDVEGC